MMTHKEKKAFEYLKVLSENIGDNYFFSKQGIKNLKFNLNIILNLIDETLL